MMIKAFSRALLVIVAVAVAPSVIAADAQGFYFGGGVGATWLSAYDDNNDDYCCYNYYYDDSYYYDTGESTASFTGFAGYRFGPYFATEVGYFYADNPEWNENLTYIVELDDVFSSFVQLEYESVQVSVLGILPFGNAWEIFLRGGAEFSQVQADQQLVRIVDGARFDGVFDNNDTQFLIGIGAGFSPTPQLHFRMEFTTVPIDDDLVNANGDTSIDSFKIEALYRFSPTQ